LELELITSQDGFDAKIGVTLGKCKPVHSSTELDQLIQSDEAVLKKASERYQARLAQQYAYISIELTGYRLARLLLVLPSCISLMGDLSTSICRGSLVSSSYYSMIQVSSPGVFQVLARLFATQFMKQKGFVSFVLEYLAAYYSNMMYTLTTVGGLTIM
jgi:hypothetical protein